jgi:NTP pyrophosphatase (non-canonical NTP hydrolase)
MTDATITVEQLKDTFKKFAQERGWQKLKPKDLSMDIVSESCELMDLFIYKYDEELMQTLSKDRQEIENEVADIAFALFNFCSTFNIDLCKAVEHKLKLTAQKYPPKGV